MSRISTTLERFGSLGWMLRLLFYIMEIDYTFKNTLVQAYFNGDDSYVPLGELKYLHSHPLVSPNFVTELEDIILRAGGLAKKYKISYVTDEVMKEGVIIGQCLKGEGLEITDQSGITMLESLRRLYKLCKDVIDKLEVAGQVL
jgi:hypothetical protein